MKILTRQPWSLVFTALAVLCAGMVCAAPVPRADDSLGPTGASLMGSAAWTTGIGGRAISLDPKQQQYAQWKSALVNTTASFTVTAWVKLTSLDGTQTFVSDDGQDVSGFVLQKRADNHFTFAMPASDSKGAAVAAAVSDFAPTPGQWYQITGVCDRRANQLRLYVDGLPLAATPLAGAWRATGPIVVGRDLQNGVGADYADGDVQAVRLYARALSDDQIAALHQADHAKFLPHVFTWTNPIYFQGNADQDSCRDPQILNDNGTYYLVFTMWPFANYTDRDPKKPNDNSSPGIALYASRDLKAWKFVSWVVKSSDVPDNAPYKDQFWAPEVHKINGRYYVIFGGSNWLADGYNIGGHMGYYQFIGVADNIDGPYGHFTALKGPGVDTSLFQDDDGKTYVVWPRNEIHAVDLTHIDEGVVTVGPKLSQAGTDADYAAIGKPAPDTIEGPYVIKHGGTYYCFFAETYRGPGGFYDTEVATAKSLNGPWTLDPRWRIFPGGHQAEFVGPDGRWWASFRHEESDAAPWLNVDPIDFDAQGNVHLTPTTGPQSVPLPSASRH